MVALRRFEGRLSLPFVAVSCMLRDAHPIGIGLAAALLLILQAACAKGLDVPDPELRGVSTFGVTPIEGSPTIGCVQCPGPTAITPMAMSVNDDGTVIVVDRYPPFIRTFDRDGNLALAFGRDGQGPGDLQMPVAAFSENNRSGYWIHEPVAFKLVHFDAQGKFIREVPLGRSYVNPSAMDFSSASFLLIMWNRGVGGLVPEADLATLTSWGIDDGHQEAIYSVERADPDKTMLEQLRDERARGWAIALSAAGDLAVGNPYSYKIEMLRRDGTHVRTISRSLPPRSREDGSKARHFELYGLDFDSRGQMWVQTTRVAGDRASVFDVFAADGAYVGEVRLTRWVLAAHGRAFEITENELIAITVEPGSEERLIRRWILQSDARDR